MSNSANILTGNAPYYIYVITGVNPKSLERINHASIGVQGFKATSRNFGRLLKQLQGLRLMLKRTTQDKSVSEFDIFYYYKIQKQSYVLYSTDEKQLNKFYDFLTLLQPSQIRPWVFLKAEFYSYQQGTEQIQEFRAGSVSMWDAIDALNNLQRFNLRSSDYLMTNKLMSKYMTFNQSSKFKHIIGLYNTAYVEQNVHFKYLMLFMILESLIDGAENSSIVYKIKRMCAVLVAEDPEFGKVIYRKVGDAYDVRSKLVHAGKSTVAEELLLFVHSLVAEVIIAIMLVEPVESIFTLTNENGYGAKRNLITDAPLKKYQQISKNRSHLKNISTR